VPFGLCARLAIWACLAIPAPAVSWFAGLGAFAAASADGSLRDRAVQDLSVPPALAAAPHEIPVRVPAPDLAPGRAQRTVPLPTRPFEDDLPEHASSLLRWRLAHSTSSGVG
jgi:hypothetical protein